MIKFYRLGRFFYDLFVSFYSLGIRVAALGNAKARKWLAGRKDSFAGIPTKLSDPASRSVWMHCASLGEFEQGRPLLEALRKSHPDMTIVLTFFSPSGYEVMKGDPIADHIFYLPIDNAINAQKFIDAIGPSLVLWVKYEYWFYYLQELKKRNIPLLLVSGIFRESQPFFKWYGRIWKKMLSCFTAFFVQHDISKGLLQSIGITGNVFVSGDTRFDRVIDIAERSRTVPSIEDFCKGHQVLVAGSTWQEDEEELVHYVRQHPEVRFIIAPHEIDAENLADVKKEFTGAIFYSDLLKEGTDVDDANVLIIDNVGMLSRLYRYADIAFIGGGFGSDGVHNVLEAAVYGKPVIFGPVYEKFAEAIGLIDSNGAISINNALELEKVIDELLLDKKKCRSVGDAAKCYVYQHAGATQKILGYIQEKRLLIR